MPWTVVLPVAVAGVIAVSVQPQPNSKPHASNLPVSPSIVAGDFIYVSGVNAADERGAATGDIGQQTREVLQRINAALAAHQRTLHDATAVTVYLTRAEDFGPMNEVYKTFVGDAPPTRTTVVANLVVPDALVEISVVAAAPGTSRKVVHPPAWLRSPNPYSYAIEAGDSVFLSGLVARNPVNNTAVPGDMTTQARTILENAKTLLAAAGLTLGHVVSARVYITDLTEFEAMNRVYRTYFSKEPPARATVKAALMNAANVVEMTFLASRSARTVIPADGRPNPNLSPAIRAGERLYVSGMLGVSPETASDPGAQTRATLQRIGSVLARAGYDWPDVVDSVVYLTNVDHFPAMNDACRGVLKPPFPARATIEAGLAAPDGLVEIMMTAVKR